MKVFLGGTVNKSTWRDDMIPRLNIDYFNPVVPEWNEDAYLRELQERKTCDYCLYILTPRMEGHYSIAEVADDSFKRPDRTIFCYIPKDGDLEFSAQMLEEMNKVRLLVEQNGGVYLKTLDDVVAFLNSANSLDMSSADNQLKKVFISYGRKHSLHFARTLHDRLSAKGYKVWFDMNNIPLAVDFQEQIDEGIKQADNFLYVMSPHSVKSEYCLKELVLALRLGKRIIPILHVEPADCWDKLHPEVGKRNWIYMRQTDGMAQGIPLDKWVWIDDFEKKFADLTSVIELHREYVHSHTVLLNLAIKWEKNQRDIDMLLTNEQRQLAQVWLRKEDFTNDKGELSQAPCSPTDLISEFIVESKKFANLLYTDVFVSHFTQNTEAKQKIFNALNRYCISLWIHERDIPKGAKYNQAVEKGIEQADNFLFVISNDLSDSQEELLELRHAQKYNKRIIPIKVDKGAERFLPEEYKNIQYLDFSDVLAPTPPTPAATETKPVSMQERVEKDVENRREKSPLDKAFAELVKIINTDKAYYRQHKILLAKAMQWHHQSHNHAILLSGYELENAKTWLKVAEQKPHPPTDDHRKFIAECDEHISDEQSDVFILYSSEDSDFASRLDEYLKNNGKKTWFDHAFIPNDADYTKEIEKGIEQSDNVLVVISPNTIGSMKVKAQIRYAAEQGKRLIPLSFIPITEANIPDNLKGLATIDFHTRDFATGFSELLRTLDNDREHVQAHTKWNVRAKAWAAKDNEAKEIIAKEGLEVGKLDSDKVLRVQKLKSEVDGLLLRGMDYTFAQAWLDDAMLKRKKPVPSETQQKYIAASKFAIDEEKRKEEEQQKKLLELEKQKAETAKKAARKQGMLAGFSVALMIGAIIVAIYAYRKGNEAKVASSVAKQKEHEARTLYLAATAKDLIDDDPTKALRFAEVAYGNDSLNPAVLISLTEAFHTPLVENIPFYAAEYTHAGAVYSAFFSADGTKILTASNDNTAKLWDTDGNLLVSYTGHFNKVRHAQFSPDGTKVLTCSNDRTAKLWKLDGQLIASLDAHTDQVNKAHFSLDGKHIVTFAPDKSVRLWDTTGNLIASMYHDGDIFDGKFLYDNEHLITVSADNTARLWDLKGNLITMFEGHKNAIKSLDIAKNNEIAVTASDDNTAIIWQFADSTGFFKKAKPLQVLKHIKEVNTASFSPDNQLIVTSCNDNNARIWNLKGEQVALLKGHTYEVKVAKFSADGKYVATGGWDNIAKLWDLKGNLIQSYQGHINWINNLTFSPDGKYLLTASDDYSARKWRLPDLSMDTKKPVVAFLGHTDTIWSAEFSPNGDKILTAGDRTARLYDMQGNLLQVLKGHTGTVYNAEFSPNGESIVTTSADNTAKIWNISGKELATLNGHTDALNFAHFSPDGTQIITSSYDGTAKLWNTSGVLIASLEGHTGQVYDAVFSPDGNTILTASEDKTARLWTKNGDGIAILEGHRRRVRDVAFSPNGKMVATVSDDRMVRLWTIEGKYITRFEGHGQLISDVCFSPDSKRLLTASWDNTARIWDIATGKSNNLLGHTNSLNAASFSPDGKYVITASWDGTARIWNTDGKHIGTFSGHNGQVTIAQFSPDGAKVLSASIDKTARLWLMPNQIIKWLSSADVAQLSLNDKAMYNLDVNFDSLYVSNDYNQLVIFTDFFVKKYQQAKKQSEKDEYLEKAQKLIQKLQNISCANCTDAYKISEELDLSYNTQKFIQETNPNILFEYARFFINKSQQQSDSTHKMHFVNDARKILQKLLNMPNNLYQPALLEMCNEAGINYDTQKLLVTNNDILLRAYADYFTNQAVGLNSSNVLQRMKQAVYAEPLLIELSKRDTLKSFRDNVTTYYTNMALGALFVKDAKQSIVYIEKAMQANSSYLPIYFVAPLSYSANNQTDKATEILKKYKAQKWQNRNYNVWVNENIQRLEPMGYDTETLSNLVKTATK